MRITSGVVSKDQGVRIWGKYKGFIFKLRASRKMMSEILRARENESKKQM